MLDAVGLLLGSRGSSEWIRSGEERALVEGVFDVSPKIYTMVAAMLEEQGIEFSGSELIVSREINRAGKTLARINGRMITIQALRSFGKVLVQQHGQHDNLILLKKEEQLRLLDDYESTEIAPLLKEYQELYKAHQQLSKQLRDAEQKQREQVQRLDFLRMQVAEIDAGQLKSGEEAELRQQRGILQHIDRLQNAVERVYEALYEGAPARPAINGELYRLERDVEAAALLDGDLNELKDYLETAQVHLAEAAEFSRNYREKLNFDPSELGDMENRLAVLEKIFRKYGENEEEVLAYRKQAVKEINELEHMDATLDEWHRNLADLLDKLTKSAEKLTVLRKHAAQNLEGKLQKELARLSMPNVRLAVQFQPVAYNERGADEVEIWFSSNKGEDLKPLAKIASGGELSRFMLALAKVLSGAAPTDTMIFDEIDTGISGTAAQRVAETMAEISRYHQVLCVTHQAQMACMADDHLLIEKNVSQERTYTVVKPLTGDERIEELAKMLGGQLVTDTTRSHARELLMRKQA